jgi:thioredoxin 1
MEMKKLGYIFLVAVVMFAGCSGTTGSNEGIASTSGNELTQEASSTKATSDGKLEHLTTQTFKQKVMDYEKNPKQWVFEGDKPAIIDFYADWCRPCRMIAPIMEELSEEYKGKIDIYKVDTEAQRELASIFGIQSLPTVLFIPMSGSPSMQKGAISKEGYKQMIDQYLLKTKSTNN